MGVSEELRALAHVVDRLTERYPDVPREHIEDIVQQEHRSLDTGRVRDYVPILVEHAAKDRLNRWQYAVPAQDWQSRYPVSPMREKQR